MAGLTQSIRGISDTARWVAWFRACETARPDALFRDPYAGRLAGERGVEIAHALPDGTKHEWAWVARTYLFDRLLTQQIEAGADLVINLAAGLDTRPYRMEIPEGLRWVEVDLPDVIEYKETVLAGERTRVSLERIALDLSCVEERRRLFRDLGCRSRNVVVASEGLLLYFSPSEVGELSADLATESHFKSWIVDLVSPGQLKLMQRTMGKQLGTAGATFQFAPPDGADFFLRYGWQASEVHGLLSTAAKLNRSPVELLSLLPEPRPLTPNFPWTGVCLLKRC